MADTLKIYTEAIEKIANDIELLKKEYPQLIDFNAKTNTNIENLSISYNYKTHKSKNNAGWTSAVPNPDKDGIWFYIDFHSPDSEAQIHTQPVGLRLCIGDKKVSFLILEGKKTKPISARLSEILKAHGISNCEE